MSSTHLSSSSSVPVRRRSSMKPTPDVPISLGGQLNRKLSLPTVHFANMPEPLRRSSTPSLPKPTTRAPLGQSTYNIPTPHSQYQYHRRASALIPMTPRTTIEENRRSYISPRPNSMLITRPKRLSTYNMNTLTNHDPTIPPVYPESGSTKPPMSLPNETSDMKSSSGSYIASYSSESSKKPIQSVPTMPSIPSNPASRSRQYDPLQHYIPCLYPNCSAHYILPHSGSMYYVPQGLYLLARLHSYCPRHVTQELADATAQCKREWEIMRQSAGRKTLGQIDQEFGRFMKQFRAERHTQDARLQQLQRSRLVGADLNASEARTDGKTSVQFDAWDWRYTPRRCTTPACKSPPYSPYATHFYAFYTTPRPSRYTPLPTLCPACAKAEVEATEQKVAEKRASQSEWDHQAWNDWLATVTRSRNMAASSAEKVQEKAVRGKVLAKQAESVAKVGQDDRPSEPVLRKKRSVFRRLFSKGAAGNG